MHQHILRTTDDSEFVGLALSLHTYGGLCTSRHGQELGLPCPVVSMLYVCSVPCSVDTELKPFSCWLLTSFSPASWILMKCWSSNPCVSNEFQSQIAQIGLGLIMFDLLRFELSLGLAFAFIPCQRPGFCCPSSLTTRSLRTRPCRG